MRARGILILAASCAAQLAVAATNELSSAEIEGQNLAQQLREMRPAEDSTARGVLKIKKKNQKLIEVPVQISTTVTATNWQTAYSATPTNEAGTTTLTVIRTDKQANQYRLAKPGLSGESQNLPGDETMVPFAGSDFWLADLGLEFFQWPLQKVLKHEMKNGEACKVLESRNPTPAPGGYARVVAWIDNDTGGIVQAEAYDARGKLLKDFEPTDFKRVNGQWQLGEMTIRNRQADAYTRLEFIFDQK